MSDIQFFETKMGRQYYDVTMPELVRQIHRLNDLLALIHESTESANRTTDETSNREADDDRI
jgi:hypothetical protein